MTKPKKTKAQPQHAQEPTTPAFVKPAQTEALYNQPFRKSDRLTNFLSGKRQVGASCNTFSVGDSIASIAEAVQWGLFVSYHQGAPSWNLSQLRPAGSLISSGGTASGAASFAGILDAAVAEMKRNEKKNGAGIAYLDWNHPDLEEFLAKDFRALYRGIYVPGNHDKDAQREFLDSDQFDVLVRAYEKARCFIVKKPQPTAHGELLTNLCVEVELPHRGTCVLGVINLSYYTEANLDQLPLDFARAAEEMYHDCLQNLIAIQSTELFCNSPDNRQFGLGVSGLASLLANLGITYEEFTNKLVFAVIGKRSLKEALDLLANTASTAVNPVCHSLVYNIVKAYHEASQLLQGKVTKAFCVQPSATGAYEAQDSSGYHSSPEIQPVVGMKLPESVRTFRKSELLGDKTIDFHPATETIQDVPYSTYRSLCEIWQRMMDLTGLAHRHSANFYGREFTGVDLDFFMRSYQRSLYYRLPDYNTLAIDKSDIGIEAEDLFSELSVEGSCSLAQDGSSPLACDCAG